MSGVWVFDKKGVVRLITNPTRESFEMKPEHPRPGTATATTPGARPRVLVYLPTNQVITSFSQLEQRLNELGWTRYYSNSSSPIPQKPPVSNSNTSEATDFATASISDPSTNPLTADTTIQATVAKPLHAANGRQPPMSVVVGKFLELAWIFLIW